MSKFRVHLTGGASSCLIDIAASSIIEVGEQLIRQRFIVGQLLQENSQTVEPPVDVLVPLQRVQLIARDA